MDMLNKLKSTVGGLLGNPVTREFEVGPHIASAGPGHLWRIYEGTKKTTRQKVSLFYLEKKYLDRFPRRDRERILATLKKGPTKLTRLRHPNLLVVEHPLEESRESIAFATEPVFASLSNLLGNRENMPDPVPQQVVEHELYEVEIKYGLLQSEAKQRKKNFSQQELHQLCAYVKEHQFELFGKAGHCSQRVEERKRRHWKEASQTIRAAGGADRSCKDIKKKWSDLKVQANKYKISKQATGGGTVSFHPVYEAVLDAMAPQARDGITPLGHTETDPSVGIAAESSQVTEALKFLHNSVHLIHGNLCPENIILNANGAWKLTGFDFFIQSSTPPEEPSSYSANEWEEDISPVAQPNLNFLAPEYILTLSCDTASDLFSLGMLMYSIVNKGRPLYDNNESVKTLKQNCRQLKSLNFTMLGSLPEGLREYVKMLLSATPTVRPDADQLSKIPFFDDVGAMTLQYLDTLFQQENIQKSKFFKGLPKILSKLPKRVILQRVLPCLCKEFYNPDMIPFVLPNVLLITELCTNSEFVGLIFPELIPVFKLQEPIQISLIFMQRMDLLLTKTPKEDVKHHVLPMVYRALEAPSPQIQELCLTILPTFAAMIELSSMKHAIIPRVKKLCLGTDRLSTRVGCLVCIGKMLEHMDKWFVLDEVLPMLMQVPSREPAVMMGILGIMKMTISHKKLGVTKDIAATKLLPFLFPLCIDNGLNLHQFNAYMSVIRTLVTQVEKEHRGKLEQLNSLKEEQKTSLQFSQRLQDDKSSSGDPFSVLEKEPTPPGKADGEVEAMFQSFGLESFMGSSSEKLKAANTGGSASSAGGGTAPTGRGPSQPTQVSLSLEEKQRLQNEQEFQQRMKKQKAIAPTLGASNQSVRKTEPKDLSSSLLDSSINRQVNSVAQPSYNPPPPSLDPSINRQFGQPLYTPTTGGSHMYNTGSVMNQSMLTNSFQSQRSSNFGGGSPQVGSSKPKVDMSAFDSLLETSSSKPKPSMNQMGNQSRVGPGPGAMPPRGVMPLQGSMGGMLSMQQQQQQPRPMPQYQPVGVPSAGQFAMYGNANQAPAGVQGGRMSAGFDPLAPPSAPTQSNTGNKEDNLLDFLG